MLLGKRPRPPMRRTTSMTGITVDVADVDSSSSTSGDHHNQNHGVQKDTHAMVLGPGDSVPAAVTHPHHHHQKMMMNTGINGYDVVDEHHLHHQSLMAMVSPRLHRRNSNEFIEPAHFLRTCGLCKRRLAPGKDIYMYRGDTAFCSLECREKQMKQDERKEKKLMSGGSTGASNIDEKNHSSSSPSTSSPQSSSKASTKVQTMAAA